jgi:hypothetical protein
MQILQLALRESVRQEMRFCYNFHESTDSQVPRRGNLNGVLSLILSQKAGSFRQGPTIAPVLLDGMCCSVDGPQINYITVFLRMKQIGIFITGDRPATELTHSQSVTKIGRFNQRMDNF